MLSFLLYVKKCFNFSLIPDWIAQADANSAIDQSEHFIVFIL